MEVEFVLSALDRGAIEFDTGRWQLAASTTAVALPLCFAARARAEPTSARAEMLRRASSALESNASLCDWSDREGASASAAAFFELASGGAAAAGCAVPRAHNALHRALFYNAAWEHARAGRRREAMLSLGIAVSEPIGADRSRQGKRRRDERDAASTPSLDAWMLGSDAASDAGAPAAEAEAAAPDVASASAGAGLATILRAVKAQLDRSRAEGVEEARGSARAGRRLSWLRCARLALWLRLPGAHAAEGAAGGAALGPSQPQSWGPAAELSAPEAAALLEALGWLVAEHADAHAACQPPPQAEAAGELGCGDEAGWAAGLCRLALHAVVALTAALSREAASARLRAAVAGPAEAGASQPQSQPHPQPPPAARHALERAAAALHSACLGLGGAAARAGGQGGPGRLAWESALSLGLALLLLACACPQPEPPWACRCWRPALGPLLAEPAAGCRPAGPLRLLPAARALLEAAASASAAAGGGAQGARQQALLALGCVRGCSQAQAGGAAEAEAVVGPLRLALALEEEAEAERWRQLRARGLRGSSGSACGLGGACGWDALLQLEAQGSAAEAQRLLLLLEQRQQRQQQQQQQAEQQAAAAHEPGGAAGGGGGPAGGQPPPPLLLLLTPSGGGSGGSNAPPGATDGSPQPPPPPRAELWRQPGGGQPPQPPQPPQPHAPSLALLPLGPAEAGEALRWGLRWLQARLSARSGDWGRAAAELAALADGGGPRRALGRLGVGAHELLLCLAVALLRAHLPEDALAAAQLPAGASRAQRLQARLCRAEGLLRLGRPLEALALLPAAPEPAGAAEEPGPAAGPAPLAGSGSVRAELREPEANLRAAALAALGRWAEAAEQLAALGPAGALAPQSAVNRALVELHTGRPARAAVGWQAFRGPEPRRPARTSLDDSTAVRRACEVLDRMLGISAPPVLAE